MLNFKNTFHLFPPLQNLNLISRWRYSHLHVTDWTSQKKHLWFALLHTSNGRMKPVSLSAQSGGLNRNRDKPLLSGCRISWTVHWWRKQGRRRGWCASCWSWVWWPPCQPSLRRRPGHGPSSEAWRNWSLLPFWRLKQKTTVIVLARLPSISHTS